MASDLDLDGSVQWPQHTSHTQATKTTYPYTPSIASTASSSSDSVFSLDAPSSQSSEASSDTWSSSSNRSSWINEVDNSYIRSNNGTLQASEDVVSAGYHPCTSYRESLSIQAVASESRQHPRRTQCLNFSESIEGKSGITGARPTPSLVRQSERKDNFVDSLVGKLTC